MSARRAARAPPRIRDGSRAIGTGCRCRRAGPRAGRRSAGRAPSRTTTAGRFRRRRLRPPRARCRPPRGRAEDPRRRESSASVGPALAGSVSTALVGNRSCSSYLNASRRPGALSTSSNTSFTNSSSAGTARKLTEIACRGRPSGRSASMKLGRILQHRDVGIAKAVDRLLAIAHDEDRRRQRVG